MAIESGDKNGETDVEGMVGPFRVVNLPSSYGNILTEDLIA